MVLGPSVADLEVELSLVLARVTPMLRAVDFCRSCHSKPTHH